MEKDNHKGKAIASEFNVKSPHDAGIRNQSGRASIAREISLPNPPPYENNFPPLACPIVFDSAQNSNIRRERVDLPTHRDTSWISSQYYVNHGRVGASGHCAYMFGGSTTRDISVPPISSFNPNALEWSQAPIEDRSLYITFSHGEPLTKEQIFWFLAMKYGIRNVLEVDIHEPKRGPVHFGRLVFTTPAIPRMILNGREEASMEIYGKSMICKKYVPKKHRER